MIVLVRDIPNSFAGALCAVAPEVAIDVAAARRQHAAYREALGIPTIIVPADDALPDCCFIEDTAVVAAGVALITRPGAPSRLAETIEVARVLAAHATVHTMEAPATLDGGDCMRVGKTIFVGRTARTNAAGIARVAEVFEPHGLRVVAVDLPPEVLHLKCVCAPLGDDRITLVDGFPALPGVSIVRVPAAESYAANVLAIADRVLVSSGFPRTHDALVAAGLRVVPLETTEFRKADGALTCLSVVVAPPSGS